MPEEKIVYDPKAHTKNQKNAGAKKVTEKDIVYPQPSATTKPKKLRKTRNLPHQPNPKRQQKFQDGTRKVAYATYTAQNAAK